jgi:hypothetical protein
LIRRTVPLSLIPLSMIAGVLAATPWLHSFPASSIAAPVFGAAVLSVLVPAAAAQLGVTRLWLSLLIDLACFVIYTLVVALHSPLGFDALVSGFYDGPSQILTFALPLVSPRSLFVAPVALAWIAGALAGECLTRRWFTIVPFPGFLVAYGLAYAATARASDFLSTDTRIDQTLISALLLMTLLVLRVAQTWVRQDDTAESTQAEGILPMRGIAVGVVSTIAVTAVAALTVQSPAFSGRSASPQRVPSVHESRPLSPVAFVASLRPADPKAPGRPVFTVQTDRASAGYFGIANSDIYDGAGWSFNRTFRPSGGVLPADSDTELDAPTTTVTQTYRITAGPMAGSSWMPYLYRPQNVAGTSINIDPSSGMIVPATRLHSGQRYRVTSRTATRQFSRLAPTSLVATGTASNGNVPPGLDQTLSLLAQAFSQETGAPLTPAIGFLQALQKDLQGNYALLGSTNGSSASASASASGTPASTSTPSAPPSSINPGSRASSTSFAAVLGSVVGPDRTGTPEQYATLVALLARQVGVPARVVSGFRVTMPGGSTTLPSGTYTVTTADAWTWVEIPVTGAGWVVLDPSPSTYSSARQRPTAAASPSPSPTATPSKNGLVTKSNGGHAVAPRSPVPGGPGSSVRAVILGLLIAVGALLIVVLFVLLARKQLRRRRRRRLADPRARAVAAWHESIDLLTEAGLSDLSALTSHEIVGLTDSRFGAEPAGHARAVSGAAQAAAYSTALLIRPEEADAAWAAERELRRQVNQQLSFGARVSAWLRYHHTHATPAPSGPASWADESKQREQDRGRRRRTSRGPARHRRGRRMHCGRRRPAGRSAAGELLCAHPVGVEQRVDVPELTALATGRRQLDRAGRCHRHEDAARGRPVLAVGEPGLEPADHRPRQPLAVNSAAQHQLQVVDGQ